MGEGRPKPFHERFDIDVGLEQAQQRFIKRITNVVFDPIYNHRLGRTKLTNYGLDGFQLSRHVANVFGEVYNGTSDIDDYVQGDFRRCLQALEALYEALTNTGFENLLSTAIRNALDMSEADLSVDWQPPIFIRTGARLMDEHLVNEPLRWLSEPRYESVRKPFEKGLSHYLEAQNRPERLADVVTDMYEATEALVKVVTGKDRDLSKNRELFIKSVQVSDYYKRLVKDYIHTVVSSAMRNG
jgi:hypothetical protein